LQIDYAVLDIAKGEVTGSRGALVEEEGKRMPKKEIQELLQAFVSMCDLSGVTRIHEWHTPPREYMNLYNAFLSENSN
jgi:hypothetical protein